MHMPANSNPGIQWTVPVGQTATPRTPEGGFQPWTLTGKFVYPYNSSATPRSGRVHSESETRHIRGIEMAKGKFDMGIRSRTMTDLYRHRLLQRTPTAAGHRTQPPPPVSKPSKFPPINGYSPPGTSRLPSEKSSDENLRRSKENVSMLPLRHVASSNSLTSYGSGLTPRLESMRPKRNSSPAIVTMQKERRVSFFLARSSSESITSATSRSSGPKSNSQGKYTDKHLRPISVMTNCSSQLSSVLEINLHEEEEKRVLESFRPQTARTDFTGKLKHDTVKSTNNVITNGIGVPKNNLKAVNKKIVSKKPDANKSWRVKSEQSHPKVGFTLHRAPDRKVIPKIGRRVSHPSTTPGQFDSISDYENPANTHTTVALIYNENTGKSEAVTETPRTTGTLQFQINREHGKEHDEDGSNDEEDTQRAVTSCAPLTIENIKLCYENAVLSDKKQQIWNWIYGDPMWDSSSDEYSDDDDDDDGSGVTDEDPAD